MKLRWYFFFVFLLIFIGSIIFLKHSIDLRLLEYIGLRQNHLIINDSLVKDPNSVQVSWIGLQNDDSIYDTLLLYNNKTFRNNIPDVYGKNILNINYKNFQYNHMGWWKFEGWYKADYIINFIETDTLFIIDWAITGKNEKYSHIDTLFVNNK